MEPAVAPTDSLTPAQQRAVLARGNVLVMAGAGTGKTKTLVTRCLDCLERERVDLDELLIVTFTEAAATEMRLRLRRELEKKISTAPADPHWPRQLALFDTAHIGTLHSFCLKLIREHFHELALDPQLTMLNEGETRQLIAETIDDLFKAHYESDDDFSQAFKRLIEVYGNGRDEKIRGLIQQLHHYSQTRPDAAGWLAAQAQKFSTPDPVEWETWLIAAVNHWCQEWLPVFDQSDQAELAELKNILRRLRPNASRELVAGVLEHVLSVPGGWPKRNSPRKSLGAFFDDADFLSSLASLKDGKDPLAEDWNWVRLHMLTLVQLAQEFATQFALRKRDTGVLDFHDLEQFALQLLWDFPNQSPTAIAEFWRQKLHFVFVDEYQDINAAQDQIIAALARDAAQANRFLVGDIKQSIYRFRLADPQIFRHYAKTWHAAAGQTIPLSENFRSRESLLDFVNSLFRLIMQEEIGGVTYNHDAALKFGESPVRAPLRAQHAPPRTELLLHFKSRAGEIPSDGDETDLAALEASAREARLLASHLQKLITEKHEIWDDHLKTFRPVRYGDIAVLARSPRSLAAVYAREFERVGVPLAIAHGGFYDSAEILDLRSLLELLDNPLQDIPCIAVLRSPLVGLSLAELAEIRLTTKKRNTQREHFWTALVISHGATSQLNPELEAKVGRFLERFWRWRKLARQVSLSQCLEQILAETYYGDWLKTRPRAAQRLANLDFFLQLAQQFDQFQRQGLFRFLKFMEAQREIEAEPDVPAAIAEDSVRLLSIHQSKGLEFPVVAVASLDKKFNERDLYGEIILDEQFGLCPRVKPPFSGSRYSSLPHWLAQKNQKRELRGEELRLLYVALTRARDTLILSAGISESKWESTWTKPKPVTSRNIAAAGNLADWLALWFTQNIPETDFAASQGQSSHLSWRLVNDLTDDPECSDAENISPSENQIPPPPNTSSSAEDLLDEAALEKLRTALGWEYPLAAATLRAAKSSVTELRRLAQETDDEAEPSFPAPKFSEAKPLRRRKSKTSSRKLSAAEIGLAHHKFLQRVSLDQISDLAAEANRMVEENILSADEQAALDLDALGQFWQSPLGQKILAQPAAHVKRELPFTARFSPLEIARLTGRPADPSLQNEFIVVQGVADLAVFTPEGIWLVDFKTDTVDDDELTAKKHLYEPQLRLYASALEKIFAQKVTCSALHFIAAGTTLEITR